MNQGPAGPKGPILSKAVRAAGVFILAWFVLTFGPRVSAQIPCHYEIETVLIGPNCPLFGTNDRVGTGISPNGRYVCGFYYQCDEGTESFVYDTTTGVLTTLVRPPGISSSGAEDVNDNGIVVGTYEYAPTSSGPYRGYVYNLATGEYTELAPLPGGSWSEARGVNNAGVVCGYRSIGPGTNPKTAFVWQADQGFTDLGLVDGYGTIGTAINSDGIVTGTMGIGDDTHPFLWEGKALSDLGSLANMETVPFAINAFNHVTGRSRVPLQGFPAGTNHAFLWTLEEGMIDLGTLPGHNLSGGNSINSTGMIVGVSALIPGGANNRAWVWFGGVMRNLNDLVMPASPILLQTAVAINDAKTILAVGFLPGNPNHTVTVILKPAGSSPADVDFNCKVNIDDLVLIINEWGKKQSAADINGDGIVNTSDLMMVLDQWSF